MGHESQIELWSPNLTTFCFAGFGTAGLRRQEAMKTAGRENPNHGVALPRNRAHGAVGQNRSRSIKWAEKHENFRPTELCFFLASTFIDLPRACGPTSSLEPQPIWLQLLIAWNSAVRTPRCKVGEVRHQWGCAVGRLHEYGGFVRICEKHFINGVLRTVSLLDDPEDSSFSRS